MIEGKIKKRIEYNYWIYVLTFLALPFMARNITNFFNHETSVNINDFIFWLIQIFLVSSIAWFIGKNYKLHYSVMCGLGIFLIILSKFLGKILIESFQFSIDYELIFGTIFFILFGTLFFGGVIFVISYPFQFLYFKLKEYFVNLK